MSRFTLPGRSNILPIDGGGPVIRRLEDSPRKTRRTLVFSIDDQRVRLVGPTTMEEWPGAIMTVPYERTEEDDKAGAPRLFVHFVPVFF